MDKILKTSNLTLERIKKYLSEGKRFDGRNPEDFREIKIETGVSKKAEGSARVKIGQTEVIVGVKMDVGTPYADSANKGNLMVTAELLPLSSPRFEAGPPKFPAIELGRVLDRFVRESKMIDLEKLCIKEGEKVWTLFIDIYTINDDGNLMDAAGLGILVALKDTKIPLYDAKKEQVIYGELSNEKLSISEDIPISITIHKVGNNFLVDPNREEEDASETRVTIGSSSKWIHSMQKGENKTLTMEEMNLILDLNEKVRADIFKKIEKFLK